MHVPVELTIWPGGHMLAGTKLQDAGFVGSGAGPSHFAISGLVVQTPYLSESEAASELRLES
mgnify:CR=1 FL=1